ncbi:MAG: hypothetical protein HRU19_08745 [Pseudobacteriovorax sp.]|nr:hypothetical protein [Pseudobacteriovorax sp.]
MAAKSYILWELEDERLKSFQVFNKPIELAKGINIRLADESGNSILEALDSETQVYYQDQLVVDICEISPGKYISVNAAKYVVTASNEAIVTSAAMKPELKEKAISEVRAKKPISQHGYDSENISPTTTKGKPMNKGFLVGVMMFCSMIVGVGYFLSLEENPQAQNLTITGNQSNSKAKQPLNQPPETQQAPEQENPDNSLASAQDGSALTAEVKPEAEDFDPIESEGSKEESQDSGNNEEATPKEKETPTAKPVAKKKPKGKRVLTCNSKQIKLKPCQSVAWLVKNNLSSAPFAQLTKHSLEVMKAKRTMNVKLKGFQKLEANIKTQLNYRSSAILDKIQTVPSAKAVSQYSSIKSIIRYLGASAKSKLSAYENSFSDGITKALLTGQVDPKKAEKDLLTMQKRLPKNSKLYRQINRELKKIRQL